MSSNGKQEIGEARRKRKTPAEIRKEAADLARFWAIEREREGDPEGSGLIRDLAKAIASIGVFK